MSELKIGSLFSGYGGLDMAVESVTGARTAWVSDIDKGACKILAHRYPDVPNIGDITKVDWASVEPVDIIAGGSPCQDLSHAGRRGGMTEGTRSNLWVSMREAIAELRPSLVIWENVRGAASAEATSDLEFCPRCMGDPDDRGVVLRALGRVLGDLSDLGYVGQVRGLRAADVGACHPRFRFFLAAHTGSETGLFGTGLRTQESAGVGRRQPARSGGSTSPVTLLPTPDTGESPNGHGRRGGKSGNGHQSGASLDGAVALLPTPTVQDGENTGGASQFDRNSLPLNALVTLLPTPAVNDMGKAYTPDEWDAWTAKMQAAHGNGNGHGKSLEIEAARLLPAPRASDGPDASSHGRSWSTTDRNLHTLVHTGELLPTPSVALADGGQTSRSGERKDELLLGGIVTDLSVFAQYAAGVARWASVIDRPPPPPTEPTGKGGAARLSPEFVSWMMGLPPGWITDVPGITRNEALRACGNGVVPQQAAAAIGNMLASIEAAA